MSTPNDTKRLCLWYTIQTKKNGRVDSGILLLGVHFDGLRALPNLQPIMHDEFYFPSGTYNGTPILDSLTFQIIHMVCFSIVFAWGCFLIWTKVVPDIAKKLDKEETYVPIMESSRFNDFWKQTKGKGYTNRHKPYVARKRHTRRNKRLNF